MNSIKEYIEETLLQTMYCYLLLKLYYTIHNLSLPLNYHLCWTDALILRLALILLYSRTSFALMQKGLKQCTCGVRFLKNYILALFVKHSLCLNTRLLQTLRILILDYQDLLYATLALGPLLLIIHNSSLGKGYHARPFLWQD